MGDTLNDLDLAEALTRGARAPLARAAVALLLQLFGFYDRADLVDRWYRRRIDGRMLVDWHQVADDADTMAVPMSDGERAVLLLAASLAVGYRVDLASALGQIDDQHGAALIMAVYSVKATRDPLTGAWDELRFAGQDDRT